MFGRRRGQRNGTGRNATLLLFLLQNVNQMERKPPLTLALTAIMCYIHYFNLSTGGIVRRYALCPDKVIARLDIPRLLVSGFLHGDDLHLYHNMVSFLWKGYHLEFKMGTIGFAASVAYLLVLSHVTVVMVSFLLYLFLDLSGPYHQCAIGFSAVLFALKVVLNHNSPAFSTIYGFQVPTKYAAWLELVVIHLLVPNASFMGHMCGILAGYFYVHSPRFVPWTMRQAESLVSKWWDLLVASAASSATAEQPIRRQEQAHPQRGHPFYEYENDEQMARRLQEEEYASAGLQDTTTTNSAASNGLTAEELRRRRLARMEKDRNRRR